MQSVLVTGANGFVGSFLVRALLRKNYQVIATGKGPCRIDLRSENLFYQSMDFTDRETVHHIFQKHLPEIVVHCGAVSKPDECELNREDAYRNNVTGTAHLIEAAKSVNAKFVFLSTDFVYSGESGMYAEDEERKPVNYYGKTKLEAEDLVMKYRGGWTIVRTVLVYGDPGGERQNLLTNTARCLKEGKSLKIFDDQVRTPTYVEDLVWGIKKIIERKAGGIFHLSGKDQLTPYQIAVAVAKYLKLDETLISPVVAEDFPQPARRPARTGFNITKARKELGYDPVSFEEGLRRTFGI